MATRHQSVRPRPGASAPRGRRRAESPADAECTAAALFDALWGGLADVIGPTATSALIQRSVKRALPDDAGLRELVIARDGFTYTYTVPPSWTEAGAQPRAAVARLVAELWPLLTELTGSVVIRRLRDEPLLRRCGVIPEEAQS